MLQLFDDEIHAVMQEKWPGCSATGTCVSAALGPEGVPLELCEGAAAGGDTTIMANGSVVPLVQLGFRTRECLTST